jgi:hypothetical protein
MEAAQVELAIAAATSIASERNVSADDAIVVSNSNKLAVRLLPGDVLARVTPGDAEPAQFEVDLARGLAQAGSPIVALDPRFEPRPYVLDGFAITFWPYCESTGPGDIAPDAYARALERLHAGLRTVHVATPHFTDRVAEAQELVASRDRTPALGDDDRALLGNALRTLKHAVVERSAVEQVLHGEPHPGNVLGTNAGPLFIDLETCCRGPIEFDVAHVPEAVADRYPGVDDALVRQCRILKLAMIATWRWDRDDQFPDGRRVGIEQTAQLRSVLDR